MNWTPGPWEVIGRSIFQKDEVGGRGVLHGASVKGKDEDEIEANIRLIAAAPELLEALESFVSAKNKCGWEEGQCDLWLGSIWHAAKDAIAKAKGE